MQTLDVSLPRPKLEGPVFTLGQWFLLALVVLYIAISFYLFFAFVKPSLEGRNSLHIGADSVMYLWIAGVGPAPSETDFEEAPQAGHVLLSFGNFLGPLLIAVTLRNTFLIACFNYLLFFLAFNFLRKIDGVQWAPLLLLLLIHPITLMSLLTLNKEILALLGVSMLFYYLSTGRRSKLLLVATVVVSFLARWEQAALTVYFLMVSWPLFQRRRKLIFLLTALALSVVYVFIATRPDANKEFIAGTSLEGNTILVLNQLQLHYLYFLVFVPKALISLYAGALNPLAWFRANWAEIYNVASYLFGGVINLLVTIFYLIRYRRWSFQDDIVLFSMYCALIMSVAPFTNPRYIFPIYVVLVLACCQQRKAPSFGLEKAAP